MIRDYYWY